MFVCNLASGSRGNSSWLESNNTCVLIDCGLPLRILEQKISSINKSPKSVQAIFLTHEHRDHILGLVAFCRKYNTVVFMHRKVFFRYSYLFDKIQNNIRTFDNNDFYFGDFTVSPFPVSHDSIYPVGFAFYSFGKKVAFVSDTGFVSDVILDSIVGSNLIFIESNHNKNMLMFGPYNAKLKCRISSDLGHLSNEQAADAILYLLRTGTKNFVLCHLSKENNNPELAMKEVSEILQDYGYSANIYIASQDQPSKIFEL